MKIAPFLFENIATPNQPESTLQYTYSRIKDELLGTEPSIIQFDFEKVTKDTELKKSGILVGMDDNNIQIDVTSLRTGNVEVVITLSEDLSTFTKIISGSGEAALEEAIPAAVEQLIKEIKTHFVSKEALSSEFKDIFEFIKEALSLIGNTKMNQTVNLKKDLRSYRDSIVFETNSENTDRNAISMIDVEFDTHRSLWTVSFSTKMFVDGYLRDELNMDGTVKSLEKAKAFLKKNLLETVKSFFEEK